jgi:glycosyltransferase involved in cell wall biosynthesis
MKISVIIPTHNREELLEKAIQSVINQTVKVAEVIIVDDGSTDNTKEMISRFENNCIQYIYQENKGVSNARNHGIKVAANKWLCFLDSDDIWEENKIEKQIDFHEKNSHILFSHTDELWIFNDKIIKQKKHQFKPSGFCFEQNIANTLIGASTIMLHKKVLDYIGYFDEELIACEDYDLWLRILAKYELGLIDEKLIRKIAGHENQLSFSTKLMDKYRIIALLKHNDSNYKDAICTEIIKKCNILIKGAIKHNNKPIEEHYTKLKMLSSN